MTHAIETWKSNGYTVKLFYDEGCESPREYENLGLFLGFHSNRYLGDRIGDETFDPTVLDEEYPELNTWTGLCQYLKATYGARVILKVGIIDHSGVAYYIGGGPHPCDPGGWDSGTCGVIFDTTDRRKACGGESDDYYTDEMITEQLTAEIEEYSQWASGQCYGYVITDSNGDEVVSCWGYIGYEYAKESASSAVPTKPESAVPLYPVRLTAQQLTSLGLPVPA